MTRGPPGTKSRNKPLIRKKARCSMGRAGQEQPPKRWDLEPENSMIDLLGLSYKEKKWEKPYQSIRILTK